MKLLHDYTDGELIEAVVIEVLGYRLVDKISDLAYTFEEEKYAHYHNGNLHISRSYPLSDDTVKELDGKKFSYMHDRVNMSLDVLFPLLNKFIDLRINKWAMNPISSHPKNCFNIEFDTHIQRHYKMKTGVENSFERAAMIALLLDVRNTDMKVQTVSPY